MESGWKGIECRSCGGRRKVSSSNYGPFEGEAFRMRLARVWDRSRSCQEICCGSKGCGGCRFCRLCLGSNIYMIPGE